MTVGDYESAVAGDRGVAAAGWAGSATVGDDGIASAGDYGFAMAGNGGDATVGDCGTARAGDGGTAGAGDYGCAEAGLGGTATTGRGGCSRARAYGTAVTGDGGWALAGERGYARAGEYGYARAGELGEAIVGYGGAAAAGIGGCIVLDGVVFFVGDDIEPDVLYRLRAGVPVRSTGPHAEKIWNPVARFAHRATLLVSEGRARRHHHTGAIMTTLKTRIEARIAAGDHIIMWADERTGDDALETWASISCDHELEENEEGDLVRW